MDETIEFGDDLLGNYETQADSLSVHLIRVLDKSEQLEQFLLILLAYADTCVFDLNFQ